MDQFLVSARKYRPATFDTVVGQMSIVTTLKNAIRSNHLAQAYLFCGPRGVGKTTCARIFARTINCFNVSPSTEACGECESCRSFNESRSYNIHELDAASNNSVEDIRNLTDQVRIPPQVGKYSIYIIDEVHMLSNQAFNAFLKTLEEPPRHAVFILATTEKHKIIPTILSRCQIFDFSRIQIDDTVQHLVQIAQKEQVFYESDALTLIAQKSDGGMRDALSIFDQLVSFTGGQVTYKNVIENLNILDYDYYFQIVDAFLNSNVPQAFLLFNEILSKGFDSHNFINGLSNHLRDLLVCKDKVSIQLLEVGQNIKEKYIQQSTSCQIDFLFEALDLTNQCDINYRHSKNQRLHVEVTLVKLCNIIANKKKTEQLNQSKVQSTNQAISKDSKYENVQTIHRPSTTITTTEQVRTSLPNYSVKNLLNQANLSGQKKSESPKPAEEVNEPIVKNVKVNATQENLLQFISDFAERIKLDKPRMYSALKDNEPKLIENDQIIFTFLSENQKEEFERSIKSDFFQQLKSVFNNPNFSYTFLVASQNINSSSNPYTPEEKYKNLATKNPLLVKFRQQFNLELD